MLAIHTLWLAAQSRGVGLGWVSIVDPAHVTKLLDATVDIGKASDSLRKQAQQWREVDDNSGAFMIIEQCTTSFGFMDRFYKQVQRQNAAQ